MRMASFNKMYSTFNRRKDNETNEQTNNQTIKHFTNVYYPRIAFPALRL